MTRRTRYIFSINTGRCGSGYLTKIFEHVEGCKSTHEPSPTGNGLAMRQFAIGETEPMKAIAAEKSKTIFRNLSETETYVETNHCFIKGFGWFLPSLLGEEQIGVIILRRDAAKVATSMLRLDCNPLRLSGRNWITTPDKQNPLVAPPAIFAFPRITYFIARAISALVRRIHQRFQWFPEDLQCITNYKLECLKWYVRETYKEADRYQEKFDKIRFYSTQLDEMNSVENVRNMLSFFGLKEKTTLSTIIGKPTNLKV